MKNIIVPIIILLLAYGCSKETKEQKTIKSFPKHQDLSGKKVRLENQPLCADQIHFIDTLLILKNWKKCNETFFHIYNQNLKYLGSFGHKGKGPSEFISPKIFDQTSGGKEKMNMWIFDFSTQEFKKIAINKAIYSQNIYPEKTLSIPIEDLGSVTDALVSSNYLVGKSMTKKGRLFFHNIIDEKTKWVPYFPLIKISSKSDINIHNIYASNIRLSPDSMKIISAMRYFKQIDIFDINGEHDFSITFKDNDKHVRFFNDNGETSSSLKHYYFDLFCSDNFIYALNNNITQDKLLKGIEINSEVQVFNWKGDPLYLYKLDRLIRNIAINERKNTLYGIDLEGHIRKYDLKNKL